MEEQLYLLTNMISPLNGVMTLRVFVNAHASFRLYDKNQKLLGCF